MEPAIQTLESWGLRVQLTPNLYGRHLGFSGTDAQRIRDLQDCLDDPEVKAILCARGGYGTLRIVDGLDFKAFRKNPKWVVGFSDLTALHASIYDQKVVSIHGPMAYSWNGRTANPEAILGLKKALFGERIQYACSANSPEFTLPGSAVGRLIGGNLSLVSQIIGTPTQWDAKNAILFIEDLSEHLYHIDRMMVHLKRSGLLDGLAGMIVGGFTDLKPDEPPFGMDVAEIIHEKVKDLGIPLCFGFPTGHWPDNYPLLHGGLAKLNVSHAHTELLFIDR